MTALLDFEDPGMLELFIDEHQVLLREQTLGKGGLMPGRELAITFNNCARTISSGTTSLIIICKASSLPRLTCCTGTATAPICRDRCTPGTYAICIWKTICAFQEN